MPQEPTAVLRYVLSFAVLYFLLMAAVVTIALAIGARPSGWNILVLIVATTCIALWFIRQNRRTFRRAEYIKAVLGCVVVDIAMQIGFTAAAGHPIRPNGWAAPVSVFGGHAILIALAFSPLSWVVRAYASRVGSS
jgi:hypothetical protein